jgi:asparagine synthase (glutamine-hydrolysing)
MCGIAGILTTAAREQSRALDAMQQALAHRGPDGNGRYLSPDKRVALIHTRLAILDTSASGAQPMLGARGHALVFNGEIYNHAELRDKAPYSSSGDAATLLRLLEQRGERALPALQGMFAFALYEPGGSLLLARDAFGQKPLYYAQRQGEFAFASETRALVAAGFASDKPDNIALGALAQKGSVPGTRTHLANISELPPGTWLRVKADGRLDGPHAFWTLDHKPRSLSFNEAADLLAPLLLRAAKRTLISDVPLAAFLSGGIDSTVVCALLQAAGAKNLRTFCVCVPGTIFDESAHAKRAADFLGTQHTTITLDEARGRALFAEAETRRDVPGIDGANTYIVAKSVRDAGLKVAISGLGGDELFGGYPSFSDARKWAKFVSAVGKVPGSGMLKVFGALGGRLARITRAASGGMDAVALYCARRSLSPKYFKKRPLPWAKQALAHAHEYDYAADVRKRAATLPDAGNQALEFEQRIYLHDQLLRDTDQFGMAVALEIRTPLLDTELASACTGIPSNIKAERGPKGLLIAAAEKATGLKFPKEITARRKQGFMLPLEQWSA